MYFFDIVDYYNVGHNENNWLSGNTGDSMLGCGSGPLLTAIDSVGLDSIWLTWQGTARATSDAFIKGVNSWFQSTTKASYSSTPTYCEEYGSYGYLYNLYAVNDSKNIVNPTSYLLETNTWHVPTESEWLTLRNYLGGQIIGGGNLKSTGTTAASTGCWSAPNTGGADLYGFTALPSGYRDGLTGVFGGINTYSYFWSTTAQDPNGNYAPQLRHNFSGFSVTYGYNKNGFAIRLVKNANTTELALADGTNSSDNPNVLRAYIGNDGRIYRTVKIGTQIWLANNLSETKYNDGTIIPIVTGNTSWAALTTGARCEYSPIVSGTCTIQSCNGMLYQTGCTMNYAETYAKFNESYINFVVAREEFFNTAPLYEYFYTYGKTLNLNLPQFSGDYETYKTYCVNTPEIDSKTGSTTTEYGLTTALANGRRADVDITLNYGTSFTNAELQTRVANYETKIKDYMCNVKNLMSVIDGDTFSEPIVSGFTGMFD